MACFFVVIFVLLSCTSGSPAYKNHQQTKESYFSPKKVEDFTADTGEAGEEYNEKIETDPNMRTELFEVPGVRPGVDRSDTLHGFKQQSMLSTKDVENLPDGEKRFLCPCWFAHCGSCTCCHG